MGIGGGLLGIVHAAGRALTFSVSSKTWSISVGCRHGRGVASLVVDIPIEVVSQERLSKASRQRGNSGHYGVGQWTLRNWTLQSVLVPVYQ
eukprot:3576097-Rhodomonas_salina.3